MEINGAISVIVTTFNDGEYLEGCLQSILSQAEKPHSIIVVDDGSYEPGSVTSISKARDKYKNILFIHQKNGGPSAARNTGLSNSKTEYTCFVDVDDRLQAYYLRNQLKLFLEVKNEVVCVYQGFVYLFPDGKRMRSQFANYDGDINPIQIGRKNGIPGGLPMYLFKTDALKDIGGIDENLWIKEDFDLLIRLGLNGGKTRGVNSATYERTYRGDSFSRAYSFRTFIGTLKFLKKAKHFRYFTSSELIKEYIYTCIEYLAFLKK